MSQGEKDQTVKKKSAAHHEMFNSSQTPWGVERSNGIVPQIKRGMDPEEMPPAGRKTTINKALDEDSRLHGDLTVQELQNELSQQMI
jgi:hypothetical protein